MKREFHDRAMKAHRLHLKGVGFTQIGGKLRLADIDAAVALVRAGDKIADAEGYRLTANESLALKTLARLEARNVELDGKLARAADVDRAAGKQSGWCVRTITTRLRMMRDGEIDPGRKRDRLNLIYHVKRSGALWLTAAGWALAWEAGFVLPNWKVPQ